MTRKSPASLILLLAVGSLAMTEPLWAQEAFRFANPKVQHKIEKSICISNTSTEDWKFILYPPKDDQAKRAPGTLEVYVYDPQKDQLVRKEALVASGEITLPKGTDLILSPVPEKSLATSLGLSKRPDYARKGCLKDPGGKRLNVAIKRAGEEGKDEGSPLTKAVDWLVEDSALEKANAAVIQVKAWAGAKAVGILRNRLNRGE